MFLPTLEEYVADCLLPEHRDRFISITREYGEGMNSERFSKCLQAFVQQLSKLERQNIFNGISQLIAPNGFRMTIHFFVRLVERYASSDFRILCARIHRSAKNALRNRKERASQSDLTVVIDPSQRMLITLYTTR